MSKLKGILLLLSAVIVMACATQPEQQKEEEPVVQPQQVEAAPVEEKPAEPEKVPEPEPRQEESKDTDITVYFAPNMYMIDTFTAQKLDSIAAQLKAKEVAQIKIVGHCAKLDTARAEEHLSLRRAVAVARYFVSTGVFSADKIVISAEGATHPAGSHAEITERKNNRRVEIYY